MKLNFFLGSMIILWFNINSSGQERNFFTINGQIKGLIDGDSIYLKTNNDSEGIDTIAKTIVKNGIFKLKGKIYNIPKFHYLFINRKKGYLKLFLDNSDITITGIEENWLDSKVIGSKAHDELAEYDSLMNLVRKQWDSIKINFEKAQFLQDTNARKFYKDQFDKNDKWGDSIYQNYIRTHKNSLYTAALIMSRSYSYKQLKLLYNDLSIRVKKSYYGTKLKAAITAAFEYEKRVNALSIGKVSPDFTSFTPLKKQLSLNEVVKKGKITLVDFWASWCRPCREETPNIRKIHDAYHVKGFNVLSVSFDFKENEWKDAIAKDSMNWYHVSNLKGRDCEIHKLYNINGIPQTYLLDSKGKIIAINLRGQQLYDKVAELTYK